MMNHLLERRTVTGKGCPFDCECIDHPHGEYHAGMLPRTDELLNRDDRSELVLAGCEENMVGFLPRFDALVLLTAPVETVLARIAERTNNDFGKSDAERARILDDIATVEPRLMRIADEVIDTTLTLDEVVDRVLDVVRTAASRRGA